MAHSASCWPVPWWRGWPFFQRLLDNPFLLLFLGVTVPTVIYLIWRIMEIIQIPLASP